MRHQILAWSLPCLVALFCLPQRSDAADVQSSVSTQETYVNLPFTLQIQINNANEHEKPVIPAVDGLEIVPQGTPSRSYRTTTINGRTTKRNTLTYLYSVTATREGTFIIPAIKVVADGQETETGAMRIVATQSETDDLMFVEIEGNEAEIFVGQALQLSLKIWIRAYRDKEFNITLNEATMWSLLSKKTQWGNFAESIQKMSKNRQRPGGKLTLREDSEGQERGYLLYEIDATVYPDRPGKIDGDDVRILVDYPEELGRTRSPISLLGDDFFRGSSMFNDDTLGSFGTRLAITSIRPIVAETEVESITVKPIPEEGRPADYRGAVGQYRIVSEAGPRTVKVGDPITLNIGITGKGPMDVLRAPPLADQASLIRDFKVPNEPLAGFVDGTQKVFSTAIRPLREGTTEIPPIEYSYFDPQQAAFVSIKSDPISITVDAADVLKLDSIVGTMPATPKGESSQEPLATRSDMDYSQSPETVLSIAPRPSTLPLPMLVAILLPPMFIVALTLFATRHHLSSMVSASRRFKRSMARATTPHEVASGLEQFLGSRFRLSTGRMLRDQTVGKLRAAGDSEIAIEVERLYRDSDRLSDADSPDRLRQNAKAIVAAICDSKRYGRSPMGINRLNPTSTAFLLAVFLSPITMTLATAQDPPSNPPSNSLDVQLTDTPQQDNTSLDGQPQQSLTQEATSLSRLSEGQAGQLLKEATRMYTNGVQETDNARGKTAFAKSAEKLQLLVDSGFANDRIFANLANAQARAGNGSEAIANYRRALRYAPTDQLYREQLASAEAGFDLKEAVQGGALIQLRKYNDLILRVISPKLMLILAFFAWWSALSMVAWRIVSSPQHWKVPVTCLLVIAMTAFTSYRLRVTEFTADDQAILVQANLTLRAGDGTEFDVVRELPASDGRLVRVLTHRGQWHKVEFGDGSTGWLPNTALQII